MERPAALDRLAAMLLEKESAAAEAARLLHDNAGPTLSAIGLHLHALGADKEVTAEINGYLERAIDAIRLACGKLRTNPVERLGVAVAIELLAERSRREMGLEVRLRLDGERRLPAPVGHAIYRIVELALDNVSQHAGTHAAEVRLAVTESGLVASIHDQGCGFDVEKIGTDPPGTGLIMMETYARRANLRLSLASRRGHGTIVTIQTA